MLQGKFQFTLKMHSKKKSMSLLKQGILEEVKEHTDWVNSYVIVEKDSGNHHSPNHTLKRKLRICLDPRNLNKALKSKPYHTCSVDDLTAKPQGMTVFIIVDFKKGYWMVVLHPESRKLTCMALPFGRFQWTRLPMGTVIVQDIFQSKLNAIIIGISMAHTGNRLVLLEKNRLPDSSRCILKVYLGEKIAKFYICSSVHRTLYDCPRIGPTSYNQE